MRRTVEADTLAPDGREQLVRRRIENGTQHRNTPLNEPDGDAIFRKLVHKGLRPVDRVDDPHPRFVEPGRIIRGFLGKPPVLRKMRFLHLSEDPVDFEIGGSDWRSVLLGLNFEALVGQVPRPGAGLPDGAAELGEFSFHGGEQ